MLLIPILQLAETDADDTTGGSAIVGGSSPAGVLERTIEITFVVDRELQRRSSI